MRVIAPSPREIGSPGPGPFDDRRLAPRGRMGALVGVGILLALVVGSVSYVQLQAKNGSASAVPVVVQRGTVAARVTATGNITAARQARLGFATNGVLSDLLVKVGDRVTAGQVLARLDTQDAQLRLDQAQNALAMAQLKLQQLVESASSDEVAAAQATYAAAQSRLEQMQGGPAEADVAAARAALASAQATFDQALSNREALRAGPNPAERASDAAALQSARDTLSSAQAKLQQINAGSTTEEVAGAQATLDQALATLRSAEARRDQVLAGPSDADLATVQAAFDQAQASATVANAALEQARATSVVPADVVQAQANRAAAESKLHNAHQNLDQLSAQLAHTNTTLASLESQLASDQKAADQTCSKLGDGSPDCATAKANVDQLQPQILQAQQQSKLLSGSGSWDQLAAQKEVVAAQAAYDAAAAALQQTEAARSVPLALTTAQTTYDVAVSQLTSARAKLDQVKAGPTAADRVAAESSVDQARADVGRAQAALQTTQRGPTDAEMVAAEAATDIARANLAAAQTRLDTLDLHAPQQLQAAQSAVDGTRSALDSARIKLDQVLAGPSPPDVAAQQAAVAQAHAALVEKSGGAARATDIALLQATVQGAEIAVRIAQRDLDRGTLYAPFGGAIETVATYPSEAVASGAQLLTLIDPHQVRLDATVDEVDVDKVEVGQQAEVTLDGLPRQSFAGKVESIAPGGTLAQGAVLYAVTISLDGLARPLPPGLTARAILAGTSKDNVLVVPAGAVRRDRRQSVVDVVNADGTSSPRPVRTGLSNGEVTEIADGLSEGERLAYTP